MVLLAVLIAGCGSAPAPRPAAQDGSAVLHVAPVRPRAAPPGSCYGAAARMPGRVCNDPRFATMVYPAPRVAPSIISASPCRTTVVDHLVRACWWGAPAARALRTVALIGDSHASVWRPAFERVVRARGWRAVSISRAGCPLTLAQPRFTMGGSELGCMLWNRQVLHWLARHRDISVVFLAAHHGHVVPHRGQTVAAAQRAGYVAALRRVLRAGVAHVVVLRDTPRSAATTVRCIEGAVAGHRPPGPACAVPRAYALRRDPLVGAARAVRSPRVQVIDLSRLWCDRSSCPPVVGGVLVVRDRQHMTDAFSSTLGPFLLRAVDRLRRRW